MQEVKRLLRGELGAAGITLDIKTAGDLPAVNAGQVEIQQVIMNLVLNAIQVMGDTPPSRRKIMIRARQVDQLVEISVADSGCGIDPAALPSLFDAFFTTRQSGLGMGLTIARGIAESHGGRIWAQNNPGGGATFFFTLPVFADEPVLVGSGT